MKLQLGLITLALAAACSVSEDPVPVRATSPQTAATEGSDAGEAGAEDAGGDDASMPDEPKVLDLADVRDNPTQYTWFDFRPNVKKLILAGAAETEHIAILWYTTADGGVGLHYHSKTESVYVIEGTQTDGKGEYPTGTLYFNPPGSGHQITDSSGFFLLAYAAPPDFMNTALIGEYSPVRIDTKASDLGTRYDFTTQAEGARSHAVPLPAAGGMAAELIELDGAGTYSFRGNYVLVLEGTCLVNVMRLGAQKLVVSGSVAPVPYALAASSSGSCRILGVAFR